MPTRCAHCGAFAGRGRSIPVAPAWLAYLRDVRDLAAPVGRLTMPLCADCHPTFEALRDVDDEAEFAQALDEIELDRLVDEGA